MELNLYHLPSLYKKMLPISMEKNIRLREVDLLPQKEGILFIPNDKQLVSSISVTKTIVVMDEYCEQDVIWWFHQGVERCYMMDHYWELELTKLQYEEEKKKKNAYRIALQEKFSVRAMKESLAYDLIHGRAKNIREIWERSKLAQLTALPNTVLLVSIDHFNRLAKNKGIYWKNNLRKEVLYVIRAQLPFHASLIVLAHEHQFAILLPLPMEEEENSREYAMKQAVILQKAIAKETPYTVTIGIGNRYDDPRNIHESFKESEYAHSYSLFTDENMIIHIQDVDYYETVSYDALKTKVDDIISVFVHGDMDGAKQACTALFLYVKESKVEPLIFRLQMIEMLSTISEAAIQHGANPKQIMPLQIKYAKKMYEMETLRELEEMMIKMLTQYIASIRETNNEMTLRSVQIVLQYMEEHYASDISLDMLANMVELSPNYLSHLFKQTTGSSFVDYLTELRLKKAKELLRELHFTIYEIAEKVGFSSSQYFSRVFKQAEGMTPTTYRNNVLRGR